MFSGILKSCIFKCFKCKMAKYDSIFFLGVCKGMCLCICCCAAQIPKVFQAIHFWLGIFLFRFVVCLFVWDARLDIVTTPQTIKKQSSLTDCLALAYGQYIRQSTYIHILILVCMYIHTYELWLRPIITKTLDLKCFTKNKTIIFWF